MVDHDTGDGRLYFFFGDTFVEDSVDDDDFPVNRDCMARTEAQGAGPNGPALNFLHDVDDDLPVPRPLSIPKNAGLGVDEVPTVASAMP